MSPTLKSTGVSHFGPKFGEEEVDRCKPNFNTTWERHEAVVCKRNRIDIFCRLSTMHERGRQTNRQTNRPRNDNMCRNTRNQRCRLIKASYILYVAGLYYKYIARQLHRHGFLSSQPKIISKVTEDYRKWRFSIGQMSLPINDHCKLALLPP